MTQLRLRNGGHIDSGAYETLRRQLEALYRTGSAALPDLVRACRDKKYRIPQDSQDILEKRWLLKNGKISEDLRNLVESSFTGEPDALKPTNPRA